MYWQFNVIKPRDSENPSSVSLPRWRCVHSRSWEVEPLSTTPGSPLSPPPRGVTCSQAREHWHGHTSCLLSEARVDRTVSFESHFMCSFSAVLSLRCHAGFSGCGEQGCSPDAAALERLGLRSCARLSCLSACGLFLDQGWNPCLLHWHQGNPSRNILCLLLISWWTDLGQFWFFFFK